MKTKYGCFYLYNGSVESVIAFNTRTEAENAAVEMANAHSLCDEFGNEVIFTSYTDLCAWMENNGTPHKIFAGDVKVPKKDICCVCGKELGIEDECYEDSNTGHALCDDCSIFDEGKNTYVKNPRALFRQIEKLTIEAGIVESKGKMFLGFFKSGGAGQKDVLLHLNGVDSGNNGCYYIDTEEFEDYDNESGLNELVDKAGKFGISRIEIY